MDLSYHHVLGNGQQWPAVGRLKAIEVPPSYAVDLGAIDARLEGMAPGRAVPLLIVWLQEMERRVAVLEASLAAASPPQPTQPPTGQAPRRSWYSGWWG